MDEFNSELVQQTTELSRVALSGQLLFQREPAQMYLLALKEDGVALGVGGQRNGELGHGLAHDDEVALGILLLSKASRGDFACRVIDATNQAQVGSSTLEPVVATGIQLQQHAFPGIAVTAPAMFGRPSATWRQDACGKKTPAPSWTGKLDPVVLSKHPGHWLLIKPLVLAPTHSAVPSP